MTMTFPKSAIQPRPHLPATACIYRITCAGQTYYGATKNYVRRIKTHRRNLEEGRHHNRHLQRAWDSTEGLDFHSEILEEVPLSELGIREQHYLDRYGTSVNIERTSSLLPGKRKEVIRRGWPEPGTTATDQAILTPRSNQLAAEQALLHSLQQGEDRGLVRSPCGTGKTKLAAFAANHFGRCLFITHYDTLIQGTLESLRETWPGQHIGVIKAQEWSIGPKWTIASLPTLIRRLSELPPDLFDVIFCDEAHLFGANMGTGVMEHFKPRYYLGLTATPERSTGTGLNELFGRIIYNLSVGQAIDDGLIVPMSAIDVKFRLKRARIGASGDYELADVARIMGNEQMLSATARVIHEQRGNRPTLVYASTRKHARNLAEALGPLAASATGDDPRSHEKIEAFKRGELPILVSVKMIELGFDAPNASCVVLATMTCSNVRFTQMVGRGMRTAPGKTDALLIDLGGNLAEGRRIDAHWNFDIEELDPLTQWGGHAKKEETRPFIDEGLEWMNEKDFEVIVQHTGNELLQPPEPTHYRLQPTPATARQLRLLERLGYRPHQDINKRQANELISAHPVTERQLEKLKALGYDPSARWSYMLALSVLTAEAPAPMPVQDHKPSLHLH